MKTRTLSLTLALALPTSFAVAQRPGGPPPGGPAGPPPNQQPGERPGQRPPRDGDQPRGEKPPLPPMPLVRALDADDDGIISATEIEKAPEALAKLDKNKDGKLTPEEFAAPRRPASGDRNRPPEPFPGQRPPADGQAPKTGPKDGEARPKLPPPLIGALDADHDGAISAAEIADAPKALRTLDENSDGQLGPREFMGRPPGKGPDGDGPKPPRAPQDQQ